MKNHCVKLDEFNSEPVEINSKERGLNQEAAFE